MGRCGEFRTPHDRGRDKECPFNIACKVEKVVNLPSHDYFIGRVIEMHMDKNLAANTGKENMQIEPLVYMGIHYAQVAGFLGKAYSIGKKIKERE